MEICTVAHDHRTTCKGLLAGALLLAMAHAAAGQTVAVQRVLPPQCVGGTAIEVRLDVQLGSPEDRSRIEALLITDRLPDGWTVADAPGATVSRDRRTIQWTVSAADTDFRCQGSSDPEVEGTSCSENVECRCLEGSCPPGSDADAYCRGSLSLDYTVSVAANGVGGSFVGDVIALLVGDDAPVDEAIGGAEQLSCAALPLQVTRTLPEPCRPGEDLTVELALTPSGAEPVSAVIVRESLPPGWEFQSATPAPREVQPSGEVEWALGTLSSAGTVRYTVRIPEQLEERQHLNGAVAFRASGAEGSLAIEAETLSCPTGVPSACVGDCNGDGSVAINEIIMGVNIALGTAQASACPSVDRNTDGQVVINELIAAVNAALIGCPAPAIASARRAAAPQRSIAPTRADDPVGSPAGGAPLCPDDPNLPTEYGRGPGTPLVLGRGFDPSNPSRVFRNDCFVFDGVATTGGVAAETRISLVESRRQLYQELGLDVRASGRVAFVRASASFSQHTQRSFSNDSLVFIVHGRVSFGERELTGLRLSREMQDLVDRGHSATVAQRCGTMFVSRVAEEVRFNIVYEFSDLREEERHELEASFSAAYGSGLSGAMADAQWRQARESIARHKRLRVDVFAAGGEAIELNRCTFGAGQNLSVVRTCIEDHLAGLAATPPALVNAVPTTYRVAPLSQLGVDECVLQGVARRDTALGEIFLAREDAAIAETRLDLLAEEVDIGLVDGPELAAVARDTVDAFADHIEALEALAQACVQDEPNAFAACRSPSAAGLVPPTLPLDLRRPLFDLDEWSFYRWCRSWQRAVPEVSPESEAANTIRALLANLLGANAGRVTCLTAQYALEKPEIQQLHLTGFPGYHAAPLQRIPYLRGLTITGSGELNTGNLVNPNLLQRYGEQLEHFALEKVGLTDAQLDALLRRGFCSGGPREGGNCVSDSQCPSSSCLHLTASDIWPALRHLGLHGNRLQSLHHSYPTSLVSLDLSENLILTAGSAADVTETFTPLSSLRDLDVQHYPRVLTDTGPLPRPGTFLTAAIARHPCAPGVDLQWTHSAGSATGNALALLNGLRSALASQQENGRLDAGRFRVRYFQSGYQLSGSNTWNPQQCDICHGAVYEYDCNPLCGKSQDGICDAARAEAHWPDAQRLYDPDHYTFGVGALCLCG